MNYDKESVFASIIMPAFQEAEIIGEVIGRVHETMKATGLIYEIIVVDDGSEDSTGEVARQSGAKVFRHPYNIGNGASVKTGIRNACGQVMVMLDADGQHPPEKIPLLIKALEDYDMAVGARSGESDSRFHRNMANAAYNALASYVTGRAIPDLTSGFRAIRANIAREFVGLLPNTFSYPSTITLALFRSGYSVTYIPIKAVKRVGKSKIRLLADGSRFFFIILKIATLFAPMKIFLPISILMFLTGLGYGLTKIFALHQPYGPTSATLMSVAVLIFLIGLVSEQVAQLRMDHNGHEANCSIAQQSLSDNDRENNDPGRS